MAPRKKGAASDNSVLKGWPSAAISDIPDALRQNAARGNFNLEETIKKIILDHNPFVPPKGDRCPINDLPNELLAHIFYLGAFESEEDEEDDMYQEEIGNQLDDINEEGSGVEDVEEEGDEGDDIPDYDGMPYQVLVSHVCKHWREVGEALSNRHKAFPVLTLFFSYRSACVVD